MNGALQHLMSKEERNEQKEHVSVVGVGTYPRNFIAVVGVFENSSKPNSPKHRPSHASQRKAISKGSTTKVSLDGGNGSDQVDGCKWNTTDSSIRDFRVREDAC